MVFLRVFQHFLILRVFFVLAISCFFHLCFYFLFSALELSELFRRRPGPLQGLHVHGELDGIRGGLGTSAASSRQRPAETPRHPNETQEKPETKQTLTKKSLTKQKPCQRNPSNQENNKQTTLENTLCSNKKRPPPKKKHHPIKKTQKKTRKNKQTSP